MMGEVLRFPPVRFNGRPPLRAERWRRPLWRWWVVAIAEDGYAFPITRSGFWTEHGARRFAAEAELWRDAAGYRNRWAYGVRRVGEMAQ